MCQLIWKKESENESECSGVWGELPVFPFLRLDFKYHLSVVSLTLSHFVPSAQNSKNQNSYCTPLKSCWLSNFYLQPFIPFVFVFWLYIFTCSGVQSFPVMDDIPLTVFLSCLLIYMQLLMSLLLFLSPFMYISLNCWLSHFRSSFRYAT